MPAHKVEHASALAYFYMGLFESIPLPFWLPSQSEVNHTLIINHSRRLVIINIILIIILIVIIIIYVIGPILLINSSFLTQTSPRLQSRRIIDTNDFIC